MSGLGNIGDAFFGAAAVDMVNHPPHYRGPLIQLGDNPDYTGRDTMDWLKTTVRNGRRVFIRVECIEVIRHITDMRLANAMKYIWRVAFGGKADDREDVEKAIWYLRDWLNNPFIDLQQVDAELGGAE